VGALKPLAAAILLALAVPVASRAESAPGGLDKPAIDRWSAPIREASERFGIPEPWIRRVIRAESGGRTTLDGHPITSRAGAMGLMQLMPATWAEMRSKHELGSDPHDPRDNILAGTAYLRAMYDRFGYPGLFAAYNAGPARYQEHLAGGKPLPPETVAYLAALAPDQAVRSRPSRAIVGGGDLFVRLSARSPAETDSPAPAAPGPGTGPELFARLDSSAPAQASRALFGPAAGRRPRVQGRDGPGIARPKLRSRGKVASGG
jgi:hypothetical protein